MSRKNRQKNFKASQSQPTGQKIKVNAMDVFRAADASSKAAIAKATFDGFDNFLSRIGMNSDNALSESTYTFNLVSQNRVLLEAAYRGSWIVGNVIDAVAEDMTREGIDITTSDKVDLSILHKQMSRLQIWQSLATTAKWGRLYGGAIGFMMIDGQRPETPLDPSTVAQGQFKGIAVYDRWQLNPSLQNVIQSGPEMGLPLYYQIVSAPMGLDTQELNKNQTGVMAIHHSRCIRYTGIDLPYFQAIIENLWGESILERLWDRLVSFDNATLSSAQLIDRANLRTVGIDGLREIIAAGGDAQAGLEAQFDMMRRLQVNEGLTLLDKNDTFASTAYSFAGLSDMMLQFGQQLSGASGIPLVRLFGQSPAGLSATGDSDIRMYYDSINAQQEAKLRNPVDVLLKVMWRSVYGADIPEDLEFSFSPLWQMDDTDRANNAKTNTETILGVYEAGQIPLATSMRALKKMSGEHGLFSGITEEDIAEADAEPAPMPDQPPPSAPSAPQKPLTGKVVPSLDDETKKKGLMRWLSKK